jgi:hypothetical protein
MLIHGVNGEDLFHALSVANYGCRGNLAFDEEPRAITQQQSSWRLRLMARDLKGPGCKWELPAWLPKRRIRGACFHARSAYMIAVFELAPTARIAVSSLCYYEGIDHFCAKVKGGSMLSPSYSNCSCRRFYSNPEEALIPDVRIAGDWRIGRKL